MRRTRLWVPLLVIAAGVSVFLVATILVQAPYRTADQGRGVAVRPEPEGPPGNGSHEGGTRVRYLETVETIPADFDGLVGIAGMVLSPDGDPLPDAGIWADYPGCTYHGSTDEHGRFELERDAPWGTVPGEYFILAEHPKYAWAARGPFMVEADHAVKDFVIRLKEGGFVSGVVTDEDGVPMSDAVVWFQSCAEPEGIADETIIEKLTERREAETDESGIYTSVALLPGRYTVGAEHPDLFDAENRTVEVVAGMTPAKADFVLGSGVSVSGWVTDLHGTPLRRVRVSVSMADAETRHRQAEEEDYLPDSDDYIRRETLTDETGSFLLRGLEPGPCHLHTRDAEYRIDRRFFAAFKSVAAPAEGITFRLEPMPLIKGVVVNKATWKPITEFGLGFFRPFGTDSAQQDNYVRHKKVTTEDGTFEQPVHDYGTYTLFVDAPGYALATVRSVRVVEGLEPEGVTVELVRGETLTFHVSSAVDGSPVGDAHIHKKTTRSLLKYLGGLTDANGTCVIENCPPGRHTFEITHDDFAMQLVAVTTGAQDVVRISLDPGMTLRVRVVSKDSGKPITEAVVELYPLDGPWQNLGTFPDEKGTFAIEHIRAGDYLLGVVWENKSDPYGWSSHQEVVHIEDGVGRELLVEVGATGRVVGTVTMADGSPPRNAMVGLGLSFRDDDECGIDTSVGVKSDGTYVLDGLSPGTHDISACLRVASYWIHKHVVVREGQDTRVDFVLGGARLHGRITVGGKALPGLKAAVAPKPSGFGPGNGTEAYCFTGKQGHYGFDGLIPGYYVLTIGERERGWWDAASAAQREVRIDRKDVRLDFAFDGERIAGNVLTPDGTPCEDARVTLLRHYDGDKRLPQLVRAYHATPWKNHSPEEADKFEFRRIAPGSYYIVAETDSYATKLVKIDKKAGEDITHLVVTLQRDTVLEAYVDSEDEELLEEIWVTVCDEDGRVIGTKGAAIEPETGTCPIFGLAPKRYVLIAHADGYAPCRAETTLLAGQENHVRFDFKRGSQVAVTVLDASRSPVPEAQVVLDSGDHVAVAAALITQRRVQNTDVDGRTALKHVADGDYAVRVLAPGYDPASVKVRIAGSDKELTVTLQPGTD